MASEDFTGVGATPEGPVSRSGELLAKRQRPDEGGSGSSADKSTRRVDSDEVLAVAPSR